MYLPTNEERKKCMEIVKKVKKTENDTLIEYYTDEVLKIVYSIGGSYNDENVLEKIATSLK